ncbi:cation-transporting P-type ATPase [Cyanobium sp. NIES-981]|uniref:cation-translocating P-type ATPase n=1 Tax=Cyanobium sp. NIES-981 TaxID=1851505 RepID=UPI0007DDA515|nr:cation-transporting P-type ATPase [Cyanobium sp. NIES-981]SBO43653.1 Cation transport ATPase [Cyanobium sp. NIES-981]
MLLSASRPIASLSPEEALAALQSRPEGLAATEARRRLEQFGANRLPPQRRRPLILRFTDQLRHFMALLLWAAGGMAFLARTPELGWAIWSVVLINALFSFWQEFQAERTLAALTEVLPRQVRVCRDGTVQSLPVEELVPGDLVDLEEGDQVPADCRVLTAAALYLNVAVLTGESLPVARSEEAQDQRLHTSETPNLLPAGTTVAAGRARALVYATGSETEFGQVVHLTAGTERSVSTLEVQVGRIVRTVTAIALAMGGLAFLASLAFVGMGPLESLVFAIGIIVANVPEGLLPTVTLALALAVRRMAGDKVLVRRLSAVETLGSVSVICTDKTGTLTANAMAVQETWSPDQPLFLLAAALCCNAPLPKPGEDGAGTDTVGDPTETALLQAALQAGLALEQEQKRLPRLQELPFDSLRRRMSVLLHWRNDSRWPEPAEWMVCSKGAPLELLGCCSHWLQGGVPQPLREAGLQQVREANDRMARQGFRVLAVAARPAATAVLEESHLVLLGLVGLYDPPRAGVGEAITACHRAGIKVTMVTGDYGLTAEAIARQIGLLDAPVHPGPDPVRVISGADLSRLSDVQLRQVIKFRSRLVFARMAPDQKLRLVQAYRALGEVVAVTGDGVNDAPALRAADVGIAMGRKGTDVAREAADIVLVDDNFASIVLAVRQGRAVFQNIRHFITYVLASNVAEVAPFLAMLVLRIPAALTVLQILAVDLGTDLLPALGLGAEPPQPEVLGEPPRRRHQPLLDRSVLQRAYLVLGMTEAVLAMLGYGLFWSSHGVGLTLLQTLATDLLHHTAPPEVIVLQRQASSVALGSIVFGQVGTVLACRSEWRSLRQLPLWNNLLLWLGIAVELAAFAALQGSPALAAVFGLAPLPLAWWGWLLACAPAPLLADELHKRWRRRPGTPAGFLGPLLLTRR